MRNFESCMKWSEKDVILWLHQNNLGEYELQFMNNDITGELLLQLDYSLLRELGIRTVGDRIRILLAINELKEKMERNGFRMQLDSPTYISNDIKNRPINAINTFLKRSITSKENKQISFTNNLHLEVSSPPHSPSVFSDGEISPSIMSMDIVKKNCIRVYGNEGQTRIIDVAKINDVKLVYKKILHKFNIDEDPEKYAIFTVNSESNSCLTEKELLHICNTPGLPEREKLILRKKHLPFNQEEFLKLKAKHASNRKESMMRYPQKDKLTRIFGQRPPSELISSHLSKFFPVYNNNVLSETILEEPEKEAEEEKETKSQIEPNDIIDNSETKDTLRESDSEKEGEDNEKEINIKSTEENIEQVSSKADEEFSEFETVGGSELHKKYMKGALIGSGSFGNVYLGLNSITGELMAIKQVELPVPNTTSETRQKSMLSVLQREIELLKELHHPNIVRYLGSQIDEKFLSILLEYVPGGSVTALLNEYGAFEETLIRSFVKQILTGLQYLHHQEIIHRDIKGGNVLVDNKGQIKITDFGISRKVQDGVLSVITNQRASLQGSVFWMAPEVVKQTHYTRKADIWALGCLIVEMLTGDHPFPNFTQMQAIFKIGSYACPEFPESISGDLTEFLGLTFQKDYKSRPSSDDLLKHAFVINE